jgi:hypothetical protein
MSVLEIKAFSATHANGQECIVVKVYTKETISSIWIPLPLPELKSEAGL